MTVTHFRGSSLHIFIYFLIKLPRRRKGLASVAYSVHAALLNFRSANKQRLVHSVHILVVFLPVQCAVEQQGSSNDLAEMKELLYRYCSSAIVEVRDWIPVAIATN